MSQSYLLNAVHLGATSVYRPGDLLDDTRDPVALVRAAGGVLMPTSNALVAAAAAAALKIRRNGGSDEAAAAVMTAAASQPLPSNMVPFAPGPTDAADVESVLASKRIVQLLAGTYTLNRPLVLTDAHSFGSIVGPVIAQRPQATIVPGWVAPSTSLADDPTNTFINAIGTIDTSQVNSYLEVVQPAGTLALTLHAAVTCPAGTWLVIEGNNASQDELQGSTSGTVILRELVQVASDVTASATIPLKWPTAQHHSPGVGVTVKGVRPVQNLRIDGVAFDPGAAYIATAINLNYAYDIDFSHVAGGGFTFSMIRAFASQRCSFTRLHDTGGGHGIVYLDSVQRFEIRGVTSEAGPRYFQPFGVPRAKLFFRHRPTNGVVTEFSLRHGVQGIRNWGGHNIDFSDGLIEDMDATSVIPASVTGGGGRDPDNGLVIGVGIDEGAASTGPTGQADFSVGCHWDNIQIVNCFDSASGATGSSPESGSTFGWWHHDASQSSIGRVQIINLGGDGVYQADGDGVFRHRGGFASQDVSGSIDTVTIRGVYFAIYFNGVVGLDAECFDFTSTPGIGANPAWFFTAGGGTPSLPKIRRLIVSGSVLFVHSTAEAANPDWSWRVDRMKLDTVFGNDVVWAHSASALTDATTPASAGNVGVLTGSGAAAGERWVVAPGAADTRQAVIIMQGVPNNTGTGVLPVALRGGTAVVSGTCDPGDILKCSGTAQYLVKDNTAVPPVAKFVALTKQTASTGLVEVVPF